MDEYEVREIAREEMNELMDKMICFNCVHAPICVAQKGGVDLHIAGMTDCEYYLPSRTEGEWVYTEKGCVITCSCCGERLELCAPDGTEIRWSKHCPSCGAKMKEV